eukprot:m.60925 g.60925  ORF g.60925 m.60925 type:complete len:382 (-) comp7970_c1_seq1:103-1248(-)
MMRSSASPPNMVMLFLLPFIIAICIPYTKGGNSSIIRSSYGLLKKQWKVAHLKVEWDAVAGVDDYKVEFNFFTAKDEFGVKCKQSLCVVSTNHTFPQPAEHEVEVTVKKDTKTDKGTVGKTSMLVKVPFNITSCDLNYQQYVQAGIPTQISMNMQPVLGVDPAYIVWSGIAFRPVNTTKRIVYPVFNEPDLHEVEASATNIYSECHSFAAFEVEYPVSKVSVSTSVAGNASQISVMLGDTVGFLCNSTGTSPKFLWQIGDLNATVLSTSSCNLNYVFNATGTFNIYLAIRNEINQVSCDPITASVKKRPIPPAKVASSVVPAIIAIVTIVILAIIAQRYHAWYKRQGQVEHANLLINKSSERKTIRFLKRDYGSVELLEVA